VFFSIFANLLNPEYTRFRRLRAKGKKIRFYRRKYVLCFSVFYVADADVWLLYCNGVVDLYIINRLLMMGDFKRQTFCCGDVGWSGF